MAALQHGVVHRDVKPENILLEHNTGRAMVADFGIARLAQASGGTGFGEVLGTPEFMSPEQAAGETVDGRSDLYSLGVVGYYAVTGRLPFEGANAAAVMAQHLTKPAPALVTRAPALPRPLATAVDRCLAKGAADRFATGEALADALGDALEGRRETPVAVRAFLRRTKTSAAIFLGAYLGLLPAILNHLRHLLLAGAGAMTYPVVFLDVAAVLVLLEPPAFLLLQIRRLIANGFGPDDVALALRLSAERRREEYHFDYGPARSLGERVIRIVSASALGTAVLTTIGVLTGWLPPLAWGVAGTAAYVGAITGLATLMAHRRKTGTGSAWATFWSGAGGRSLFWLAGLALKRRPVSSAGRPTELAIGSAAGALLEALPKEVRRALGDLPRVVRRLEDRAQAIRRRVEELDRLAADSNAGVSADVQTGQRRTLVADLEAAREAAQGRLGQVVAALESIRLDLLRLRAGAGTVESVTADLTAAREVSEQAERLLAAGAEVQLALQQREAPAS